MATLDKAVFIVMSKAGYVSAGYGAYATPKLYTKAGANGVRNERNRRLRSADVELHKYFTIPVTLVLGEPLKE